MMRRGYFGALLTRSGDRSFSSSSSWGKDYHAVLGLKPGASKKDIKKQYRKLAMRYHPDRNAGDANAEKKFKEISEAYQALTGGGGTHSSSQQPGGGFSGYGGQQMSQEDAERMFREFEKMFGGAFTQAGGVGGFPGGMNASMNMGNNNMFSSSSTVGINEKGQHVRRTEVLRRGPDGRMHREVHEEVITEESQRELLRQQEEMLNQMKSAAKTAVKEAIKGAVKRKTQDILGRFGFGKKK